MPLDPLSLFTASLLVLLLVSSLLLLAWLQNRQVQALAWWSLAFLLAGLGFTGALMGADSAHSLVREVGNAAILLGYGLSLKASRQFNQRATPVAITLGGSFIWLFACWVINIPFSLRLELASLLCGGYTFAMAYELWFGARERLISQRTAALLCGLHGFYFILRIITGPTLQRTIQWVEQLDTTWALIMSIETLVYATSFGFLIVSMAKEQIEARHRRAALQDPLTGIANRRAFKEQAEQRLARNQALGRHSSVMLFDLDHFKAINDGHGHDAGDQVLIGFCELVEGLLDPETLFCRMGGEEFAAFLSGEDPNRALTLAERIRAALEDGGMKANQQHIAATVSIGIVISRDAAISLRDLLAHADAALYEAKAGGRNRVAVYCADRNKATSLQVA